MVVISFGWCCFSKFKTPSILYLMNLSHLAVNCYCSDLYRICCKINLSFLKRERNVSVKICFHHMTTFFGSFNAGQFLRVLTKNKNETYWEKSQSLLQTVENLKTVFELQRTISHNTIHQMAFVHDSRTNPWAVQ